MINPKRSPSLKYILMSVVCVGLWSVLCALADPSGAATSGPVAQVTVPDTDISYIEYEYSLRDEMVGLLNKAQQRLPGALLLLLFSAFFSSINFLSELPEGYQPLRVIYRYLIIWVLTNYIFALIILLLILPPESDLHTIDKTIFFSALLAAALPELSANLRLQLGRSNRTLDLYKYKTRISSFITAQLERAIHSRRNRQLYALDLCYTDQLPQFQNKLNILMDQGDLSDEERQQIKEIIDITREKPLPCSNIIELLQNHQNLIPKILDFYGDDLVAFENSPKAQLIYGLQPHLNKEEATALVKAGIIRPSQFLRHYRWGFLRRKLIAASQISEDRIKELYYSTVGGVRRRRRQYIKWSAVFVVLFGLALSMFGWYGKQPAVSIDPSTTAVTPFAMEDIERRFSGLQGEAGEGDAEKGKTPDPGGNGEVNP